METVARIGMVNGNCSPLTYGMPDELNEEFASSFEIERRDYEFHHRAKRDEIPVCFKKVGDDQWDLCREEEVLDDSAAEIVFGETFSKAKEKVLEQYVSSHRMLSRDLQPADYDSLRYEVPKVEYLTGFGTLQELVEILELYGPIAVSVRWKRQARKEIPELNKASWAKLGIIEYQERRWDGNLMLKYVKNVPFGSPGWRCRRAKQLSEPFYPLCKELASALGLTIRKQVPLRNSLQQLDSLVGLYNNVFGTNQHRKLAAFASFLDNWRNPEAARFCKGWRRRERVKAKRAYGDREKTMLRYLEVLDWLNAECKLPKPRKLITAAPAKALGVSMSAATKPKIRTEVK